MKYTYVGIDPGETGAIAFIYPGQKPFVYDFEDGLGLLQLQDVWDYRLTALLERVHAHPKQGVSSTAKFMTNFGRWIGR